MIRASSDHAFDALAERLIANFTRALTDRRAARDPSAKRALADARWRSAEHLWPEFAPSINRASKD